jgi:hypothetical protein
MSKLTVPLAVTLAAMLFCLNADEAIAAGKTCRDESCFARQVAACDQPSTYTTPVIAEAQVRYTIFGSFQGGCDIEMRYVQHPNPDWVDNPMLFSIDPEGDIDAQIKLAVASCLEGSGGKWGCDGPFYDQLGVAAEPAAPVASAEPPCGVDVEDVGPPLYPMPRNGQWGYLTREGEWAIEPRWDYAAPFSEGRAAVEAGGRWGVNNQQGEYVLEPVLRSASCAGTAGNADACHPPLKPFSQGCSVANVQKDGSPHAFFVARNGQVWLDDGPPDDLGDKDIWSFGRFSGGRAWFQAMGDRLAESFGWIDANGNVVLTDDFSGAGEFVDGKAPASSGGRPSWAYIDTEGNPVIPAKWTLYGARPFSEGYAAAKAKSHQWMYFDAKGAVAFDKVSLRVTRDVLGKPKNEADIEVAGDFHDGLAPIRPMMMFDAAELIYVRPDGTEAFAPGTDLGLTVCQSLPEFHHGLVQLPVAEEGAECGGDSGRYVYVDTAGNIVLQETD